MQAPHTAIPHFRPTVAEINLDTLIRNAHVIVDHAKRPFMAIMKADAYGHGAVPCLRALEADGIVSYAAVATAEEALELRLAGIRVPVLILGITPKSALFEMVRNDITCTLTNVADALALNAAAMAVGKVAKAHLKIETGLGRLGIEPADVSDFWEIASHCRNLDLEGMFTHFAAADEPDPSYSRRQLGIFKSVVSMLEDRGCRPRLVHCCATPGLYTVEDAYFDMVRPGLVLYGGALPEPCCGLPVSPVMELRSEIVNVRTFAKGCKISYGCIYTCPSDRRIAVLPIGYADGVDRRLHNRGPVLIAGKLTHIVGKVCMDMIMVDVTDIPEADLGTEAILFGDPGVRGPLCPNISDLAVMMDRIPYELTCGVSARVPRVYVGGGI